jgi:hypothetical protein
MTQVNSPYLIKKVRPREELDTRLNVDTQEFQSSLGSELNNYLDQIERFLEQIYRRTGGAVDTVEEAVEISDLLARIAQTEYELTDDPFTVESTGWTVDTSYITADWTKA